MTIDASAPVVVGVDGSTTADRALLWAADVACRRQVPLEVVHAWRMPVLGELPGSLVLEPVPYEHAAREVLDGALATSRHCGFADGSIAARV